MRSARRSARFSACHCLRLSVPNHEADEMGESRAVWPFRFVLNFRSTNRGPADHAALAATVYPRPEAPLIHRPQFAGAQPLPNNGPHSLIIAATRPGEGPAPKN